ncbi:hypothetical protein F030043B2_35470 [Bacteroides fragilis]
MPKAKLNKRFIVCSGYIKKLKMIITKTKTSAITNKVTINNKTKLTRIKHTTNTANNKRT